MTQFGYIGRKMRLPRLKDRPAIVIAAFGTSTRAGAVSDVFRKRMEEEFPEYEIFYAWTSEIIRKKLNLPGLHETLAQVEASGLRKAVVQPLHIFPGTEYTQLVETCTCFPGLRVLVGETLLHRWEFIREMLKVIEQEFLPEDKGINILVLHGTPLAADPVNTVYLGFEHLVNSLHPNVYVASVEGIPDARSVFGRIRRDVAGRGPGHARIVPVMYVAGLHAEEDLMGNDEDSWRMVLEAMGFNVDMPVVQHEDQEFYKGLAWYPEVTDFFVQRISRSLELMQYF